MDFNRRALLASGGWAAMMAMLQESKASGFLILSGAGGLKISGSPVTAGQVGQTYPGFTVTASGGTAPYTYSLHAGTLPPPITLGSSTGIVSSGTLTTQGTYSGIVIRVTDATNRTADLAAFQVAVQAAGPPIPNVANQTIAFGALTRKNAGKAYPTNAGGGAITSTAITGGTLNGDANWVLDADGALHYNANGTGSNIVSGTLICTFSNGNGSQTGVTLTISPIANAYSVVPDSSGSQTEGFAAKTAIGTNPSADVAIYYRSNNSSGNITGYAAYERLAATGCLFSNFFGTAPANSHTLTVTSHDQTNKVQFRSDMRFNNTTYSRVELRNFRKMTFTYIEWYCVYYPAFNSGNTQGFTLIGGCNYVTIDHCELHSNMTDLWGTLGQDGVTTINYINFVNGTVNGIGVAGILAHDTTCRVGFSGFALPNTLTITNNKIHGSWRLLNLPQTQNSATILVDSNEFYDSDGDHIVFDGGSGGITVSWNLFHSVYCPKQSLNSNSVGHNDFCQLTNTVLIDSSNINIFGNLMLSSRNDATDSYHADVLDSNTKHQTQGPFIQPYTSGNTHTVSNVLIYGNVIQTAAGNGILVYNGQTVTVRGNTVVFSTDYTESSPVPDLAPNVFCQGATVAINNCLVEDNVSANGNTSALTGSQGSGNTATNNYAAAISGGGANYSTVFVGPTFNPVTITAMRSAFTLASGGPLDTASPKIGALGTYVNFDTHVTSFPWGP